MKLSKISLAWVRISILSIIVIVAVIFISKEPTIEKVIQKIKGSVLLSMEQQWNLEIDKTYTQCGHTKAWKQSYPSLQVLKNAVDGYQGLALKKIMGKNYVYGMQIIDFCQNCKDHQFLGIKDKNVVIIRGTPDSPGPVLEQTEVKIDNLPPMELQDLQKGIPFKNSSEKLQLIEGLKGLNAN